MSRLRSTAFMLLLLGISADSEAASSSSTIHNRITRVYVSNSALSIAAVGNPSSCPYGIVSTDQDPAYDRWISLAMLAFQTQYTADVEYDASSCKLLSLAVNHP